MNDECTIDAFDLRGRSQISSDSGSTVLSRTEGRDVRHELLLAGGDEPKLLVRITSNDPVRGVSYELDDGTATDSWVEHLEVGYAKRREWSKQPYAWLVPEAGSSTASRVVTLVEVYGRGPSMRELERTGDDSIRLFNPLTDGHRGTLTVDVSIEP